MTNMFLANRSSLLFQQEFRRFISLSVIDCDPVVTCLFCMLYDDDCKARLYQSKQPTDLVMSKMFSSQFCIQYTSVALIFIRRYIEF